MTKEDEKGFLKFQKETKYNKLLPYYDKISVEADEQFSAIKAGLGHSILLREVRPALLHWACELDKYIYLHGRRFTKEDHILFVKIFYELICMPGLELRLVKTFCHILTNLLAKPELLSRDDLELDWRRLYDLYVFVAYKNLEEDGLLLLPKDMAKTLEQLVKHARRYFSVNSTQEILSEVRPLMCPWDMSFVRAVCCLNLFLCTDLPPEHYDKGYKLWLDELVYWWLHVQNCPPWESKVVQLLSRLTHANIGYIDWNDRMPDLFTKLLRSFGLCVSAEKIEVGFSGKLVDAEVASIWIASMMGGKSNIQQYINQFFKALESYVHPSNAGKWQNNILNFMQRLALAVCQRVHRERHRPDDWRTKIPEDCKLTDDQIQEFVNSLLPCALNGMFAKMRADLAVNCLRYLSHLSPKLVVPAVLEKLYPALETLTEPHRLTQSMNSMVAVVLPLIRESGPNSFRSHVIPLMTGVLPGLDPNDVNKSMLTLQALSLFSVLVPIVDCSEAANLREDLTAEEKELCSATATFESYVNQFMDKLFSIVETVGSAGGASQLSRRRDSVVKYSMEENLLKSGMYAAFRALLGNCSSEIYQVAVDRLYSFITDNVLEGRVTAEMLGELCFSAVRTNPSHTFGRFLSFFLKRLKYFVTDDIINDDEVDVNIMWYLTMCTQIVRCDGDVLVSHKKELFELLNLLAPMKSKEVYTTLSVLLENLLLSLTFLYIREYEKDRATLDQPLDQYLPVRHWGEACEMKNLKINWHTPTEEHLLFARELHELFVIDQLKKLEKPEKLHKDGILKSLSFIKSCLSGSACVLPQLDGPLISVIDSSVDFSKFSYICDPNCSILDYNGENVRVYMYSKLHTLMEFLLNAREDETKCLNAICSIFNLLLFHRGLHKAKYDAQSRGFNLSKVIVSDKVIGKKSFIKSLVTEMVLIQHHKRLMERSGYYFTEVHLAIAHDLLKLSTSQYSEVRREAQSVLDQCMNSFPYSYRLLLENILAFLRPDAKVTHEQFKGALYVLMGTKSRSLLTRHHWSSLVKIWPAVIRAQHSEKPSIIKLLEDIQNTIVESIESFQIKLNFTDEPLKLAKSLWNNDSQSGFALKPSLEIPSPAVLDKADADEKERNQNNEMMYYDLIRTLVELSNDANLHWRHLDMAQSFLSLLIRLDMRFPAEASQVFVRLLVHDSLKTRKMAIGLFAAVLKIHRKKSTKITFTLDQLSSLNGAKSNPVKSSDKWPIKWGLRNDNAWLAYRESDLPKSEESWDKFLFVEKTHHGFYCWPNTITLSTPINQQKHLVPSKDDLSKEDMPLFESFNNAEYVQKFCRLISLEEKKEEDHFHSTNFMFFKGLFRSFGDMLLPHFKDTIEDCVESPKESEQRFAAEFTAGLISGAKYWPFVKQEELWSWLVPVMRTAFDSLTTETFRDWGTCVATVFDSRDPRKLHWLVEILLELAKKPMDASFNAASRYFLLQGGINQQEWRVLEVWHQLLAIVETQLAQPYQNLRDRLGSVLSTIFWFDIADITLESDVLKPPNMKAFLEETSMKLSLLWKEIEMGHPDDAAVLHVSMENPQRKNAILLLKTMLCYFNSRWVHAFDAAPECVLKFLPLLCYYENETSDDELKRDCHWQLMQGMARALLHKNTIPQLLVICRQVAQNKWWKVKVSVLRYLQVALFSNLFYFLVTDHRNAVKDIIFTLMKDNQLEVRVAAAESLSGLLHCCYFATDNEIMNVFRDWVMSKDIAVRHAGVLGLSAIVKSCPYTVPAYLPQVLMWLCPQAAAPLPIATTAKNTLADFKRTHHDCWHEHKERFTDDQLCVLTDLLVSPTYYV